MGSCRTEAAAKQHVLDHRIAQVDDYVQQLGIGEESVTAAIKYAGWSAAAEYRLLASKGIKVGELRMADLEPYLGRGCLPVLEHVSLALLNATKVDRRQNGLVPGRR